MAYQIAKEIGGMAAVLKGEVDGVIITGGIAHNPDFIERIAKYIRAKLLKIHVVPGEFEMKALAEGALRVLKGEEEAKEWRRDEK